MHQLLFTKKKLSTESSCAKSNHSDFLFAPILNIRVGEQRTVPRHVVGTAKTKQSHTAPHTKQWKVEAKLDLLVKRHKGTRDAVKKLLTSHIKLELYEN